MLWSRFYQEPVVWKFQVLQHSAELLCWGCCSSHGSSYASGLISRLSCSILQMSFNSTLRSLCFCCPFFLSYNPQSSFHCTVHYLSSRKVAVRYSSHGFTNCRFKEWIVYICIESWRPPYTLCYSCFYLVCRRGEKETSVPRYSLRSVMASENKFLSCTFVDGFCVFHVWCYETLKNSSQIVAPSKTALARA